MRALSGIIIILCVLKLDSHEVLPSEDLSNTEELLLQCVLSITSRYSAIGGPVTVVPSKYEEQYYLSPQKKVSTIKQTLIQQLLYSGNYTFWFNPEPNLDVVPSQRVSGSVAFIVDETSSNVLQYVALALCNLLLNGWDPRGMFVFVLPDNFGASKHLAKLILSVAWRADVINAIAVVPNTVDLDVVDVYGWLPDDQKNLCYKILTSVTLLDRWESSNFLYNNELFPSKQVQDMRGCTVQIFYYGVGNVLHFDKESKPSGYAALTTLLISRLSNFRLFWFPARDFVNIGYLHTQSYILALRSLAIPRERLQMYEFSYPVTKLIYTWLVPVGAPVPRWQALIRIFSPQVWIFIPIAFVLLVAVLWIQRLQSKTQKNVDLSHCFLVVLQTHLAMGLPRVPRGRIFRFIFALCLFYSLQVYTAYQSGLISFLANPGRYPPIRNRDELQESGIELTSFLYNIYDTAVSRIVTPHKSVSKCTDSSLSLHRLMCVGDLAIAAEVEIVDTMISNKQNYSCPPQYHALEDSFYEGYYGYCFTRGSVFFDRFNTLLWRLQSSGLMNLWNYYYVHEKHFYNIEYNDSNVFVMTLFHLQGAFYLLTLGISLSVLVFMVEVCYYLK